MGGIATGFSGETPTQGPRGHRQPPLSLGVPAVPAIAVPAIAVSAIALLAFLVLLVSATPAIAQAPDAGDTLRGRVIKVTDGDTLDVQGADVIVTVRLHGVDAPESNQPYGDEAEEVVRRLAHDKTVEVEVVDVDRYGRAVGRVILPDGGELNRILVYNGYAWWYEQYARGDRDLERLQNRARAENRGLWQQDDPVPPWDWRRGVRSDGTGRSGGGDRGPDGDSDSFRDRDCSDFETQAEAQRFFEEAGPGDPHRLDADGDGEACESLP